MYVTQFVIYGSRAYPHALSEIYARIADEFILPDLATLQQSLNKSVRWPTEDTRELQIYFLENMMEDNETIIFQIRFRTAPEARDMVAMFVSIRQGEAKNLTVTFTERYGRMAFSRMLQHVKSVVHTSDIDPRELQFEVQGFPEEGPSKFVREHSLSAFIWYDLLGRYLHAKERFENLPEVRRGRV